MGFVSGMLGMAGGVNGTGAQGPRGADLIVPENITNQTNTAYNQTQEGIDAQRAFLQALQAQNGIQNQSNVFNQMQGIANGTGPNPALAQLANATGQNVQQQAALMGSQRGAASNPALMARQAAMQGANIQQNAAGQAAALQAQQQLNALGQMGGMAGQQVQNLAGATQGLNAAAQGQQQNILNMIAQQNQARVGEQASWNKSNADQASAMTGLQGQLLGGVMNGIGGAVNLWGGPKALGPSVVGGSGDAASVGSVVSKGPAIPMVNGMAEGGQVPKSQTGQFLMAKGGKVPVMLSPGEKVLPPQAVKQVASGANPMAIGQTVPGKPAVAGAKNSYANDTVPANLDEGGIVIPRSITQSKDAAKKAAAFVEAILAKKGQLPRKGK